MSSVDFSARPASPSANFESGPADPSAVSFHQAKPLAPNSLTKSVKPSTTLRDMSAPPLTTIARTLSPRSIVPLNTLKEQSRAQSSMVVISIPKRQSGLSEP